MNLKDLAREFQKPEKKEELMEFYEKEKINLGRFIYNIDGVLDSVLSVEDNNYENNEEMYLCVTKIVDFDEEEGENISIYDTAIFMVNEKELVSTLTFTFKELVNMPIFPSSLREYGDCAVFLFGMYEVSFFGCCEEIADKNQKDFLKGLDEARNEVVD